MDPPPHAALPAILRLLADETRWRIIAELRVSDRQVGDLCVRLGLPQNLASYHLGLLRQSGLVYTHRSDADGRALYYGLNPAALRDGLGEIAGALSIGAAAEREAVGPVLFICTRNSARSQMAEGWLRRLGESRIVARSAGTVPAEIHPLAVAVMAEVGVDIGHQRAKTLDAVAALAPQAVVTVCDLAREQCQSRPPAPFQLHWSIPDPVAATGSAADRIAAFRLVRDELAQRVAGLLTLLPARDAGSPAPRA